MQTTSEKLEKANAIIAEVKNLRIMQKEYFKYRDTDQLTKCKIQERKIDALIADYDQKPNLFS